MQTDFDFKKSSLSEGWNCVEVGWRKASASGEEGGNCVEMNVIGEQGAVRDSKNPEAGHLAFSRTALRGLTAAVSAAALVAAAFLGIYGAAQVGSDSVRITNLGASCIQSVSGCASVGLNGDPGMTHDEGSPDGIYGNCRNGVEGC